MDEKLARAFDALQQAHEAGNAEDAQQLADYIRTLQAEATAAKKAEEASAEKKQSMVVNPATVGAAGAAAGLVGGPYLTSAVDALTPAPLRPGAPKITPQVVAPPAAPISAPPLQPAETYHTPHGLGTGAMKNIGHNIGQKIGNPLHAELLKNDPMTRGYTLRGNSLIFTPSGADIGVPVAPAAAAAPAPQTIPLTAKQRAMAALQANKPVSTHRIGNVIGTGLAAGLTKDMIEQAQQGNLGQATVSGLGAIGGIAAQSSNPRLKALGYLSALGAPAVRYMSEKDKKAAGGAIKGYATGEKVVKAVKGGLDLAVGKEPASIKNLKNQITPLWERFGYDPKKIAQQYPDVLPPTLEIDKKTGKQYLAKQLSPEALAVQKARQAAQKEIDTGSPLYQPYFDITKRSYVNPADYPLSERTLDLTMPKKADTLAKHRAMAQSPEATARLESAYDAAAGSPTAHGFYMMKQLQDEYIKEYGPELGRLAFKRDFADPMAATTGGQTPTANLMMTAMHNYFANKGMPMPSKGYEIPYPVGGNKLQSNIDMSQKLFNTGSLPAADSPKRFNFSSNFLGHSDRPTIDEQMMSLFNPGGKGAPDWYGVNEEAVNILSKLRGVEPVNYQEVAWAGAKGYPGQPMIEDVNQMIYRTHRITGEPQKDVLRRFIRREGPMYGITGLGALQATDGVNNPE